MSLIFLYRRIMNRKAAYSWALHLISAIVVGYSIAIIFALVFACNPIEKAWDSTITTGSCVNRSGLYIATAVTNIVTDFALIIVPIPLVVSLQMPKVQKIYLVLIFFIGCAYVQSPLRKLSRPLTILFPERLLPVFSVSRP